MHKKIIWALFDSGNGCYKKSAEKLEDVEIYSIGMDIENKNDHFIHLDLADYSRMFGDKKLFNKLDELPKPDVIIASPPCESWSIASAMKDGNASWKQEKVEGSGVELSKFTVRDYSDYERYQFKPEKSLLNRINGELCTFNTIEIIKRYNPKVYIIENPLTSKMFKYIEVVLGFESEYENKVNYSNYDYPLKKPTKFVSNINLDLDYTNTKGTIEFKHFSKSYNERSNIPEKLVDHIFNKTIGHLNESYKSIESFYFNKVDR